MSLVAATAAVLVLFASSNLAAVALALIPLAFAAVRHLVWACVGIKEHRAEPVLPDLGHCSNFTVIYTEAGESPSIGLLNFELSGLTCLDKNFGL